MAILTRLYLPRVHEGRFRYYGSYAIIDLGSFVFNPGKYKYTNTVYFQYNAVFLVLCSS